MKRFSLTLTERKPNPPLQAPPHTELFDFASPSLSAVWGRPIHMRGVILLPPGYSAGKERYPTVYMTHGFGGDMKYLVQRSTKIDSLMQDKKIPEMIWVMLLEASPTGTHEFADSANNGPWGTATDHRVDSSSGKNLSNGWKAQRTVSYRALFGRMGSVVDPGFSPGIFWRHLADGSRSC